MSRSTLTKAQLIDVFGESHKQIERYVAEGLPCVGTGRDRRFPWPEVRNWRDERIRKQERDKLVREQPTDLEEAKRRRELAMAEKAELEVLQMRGESIPLDTHEQRIEAVALRLAGPVRNLDRYISDVQRALTAGEAKAVLDKLSDDLLLALQAQADDIPDLTEPVEDDSAAA